MEAISLCRLNVAPLACTSHDIAQFAIPLFEPLDDYISAIEAKDVALLEIFALGK